MRYITPTFVTCSIALFFVAESNGGRNPSRMEKFTTNPDSTILDFVEGRGDEVTASDDQQLFAKKAQEQRRLEILRQKQKKEQKK